MGCSHDKGKDVRVGVIFQPSSCILLAKLSRIAQRQSGRALHGYLVKDTEGVKNWDHGHHTCFHLHSSRIQPCVNIILLFLQPAFQEELSVPVGVSQTLTILAISPAMAYPLDYLLPANSHIDGNLHDPLLSPFMRRLISEQMCFIQDSLSEITSVFYQKK